MHRESVEKGSCQDLIINVAPAHGLTGIAPSHKDQKYKAPARTNRELRMSSADPNVPSAQKLALVAPLFHLS